MTRIHENSYRSELRRTRQSVRNTVRSNKVIRLTIRSLHGPDAWVDTPNPLSAKNTYSKAADLIKSGWTQAALSRDSYGRVVNPHSEDAVSFCLVGSICKASGVSDIEAESLSLLLTPLYPNVFGDCFKHLGHIEKMNDNLAPADGSEIVYKALLRVATNAKN